LREFIKDEQAAKGIEQELLENAVVKLWLKNLKPETPPQHWSMEHGSFDFCFENALLKSVQLGLHCGLPQVIDAVKYYAEKSEAVSHRGVYRRNKLGIVENLLMLADYENEALKTYISGSLNEMYDFVSKNNYNIYIGDEERDNLKAVPAVWKDRKFIKRSLVDEYGFCYPLIYDIVGLHKLYRMNPDMDEKINAIIEYISTDEFHSMISDSYGILISSDKKYHSMGWDPKYPGWFDVAGYMENVSASKLLFFAQYITKYPVSRKTKWYGCLLEYLDKYKTERGTYEFPAAWLKEKPGYAVQGNHLSYGENRKKKNWREIESTFFILTLSGRTAAG